MAELTPYPFAALTGRAFRELDRQDSIFDLPRNRFVLDSGGADLTVDFHGRRASSPLGPAAGPQTQMAQNLVLAWLGGCRIMELKTVQINDELELPRPCIDMRTIGFNAEWSQELKLEQSLEEYVKGSMLIEMLRAGSGLEIADGFDDVIYDISVGYDLAGIQTERVQAFIDGIVDAGEVVERLRSQIPDALSHLRGLDFTTRLSDTVTLSTFHGCPPGEIEQIIEFLLTRKRLHSIIKFNPMLLGSSRTRELLHNVMGYRDLEVPESAFEHDIRWQQAVEMMERLAEVAGSEGLGMGAKFSNTLIVKNTQGFLPADETEVYLSGQPLHVLALQLVRRFRRTFGNRFPISFAAGIDRQNFPDAVALGLVPVTVCTDLLRKGGYGRLQGYYRELERRMSEVGATDIPNFIVRAYGKGGEALEALELDRDDPRYVACSAAQANDGNLRLAAGEEIFERWVSEALLINTEHHVPLATQDPRYSREQNAKSPKKIGSHLVLFDCVTCDLCVPVCPNDANFTYHPEESEIPVVWLRRGGGKWTWSREGVIELERRHQIANFADFCNDCGNCDVFCPEDGGPYAIKPRFFGHEKDWREATHLDGFYMQREAGRDRVLGRTDGRELSLERTGDKMRFRGPGFDVRFEKHQPETTLNVQADGDVDITWAYILDSLRTAVLDGDQVNYVNSLVSEGDPKE